MDVVVAKNTKAKNSLGITFACLSTEVCNLLGSVVPMLTCLIHSRILLSCLYVYYMK